MLDTRSDHVRWAWTLTENVGQADDHLRLYSEGRLTAMTRRVYEVVASRGRLTTRQIRAEVEPDRRGSSARLLRALGELQNLFLLARVGEVGDNPGNYAYVWDLFERAHHRTRANGRGPARAPTGPRGQGRGAAALTPAAAARGTAGTNYFAF